MHWFWDEVAGIVITDLQSWALVLLVTFVSKCTYLLAQARIPVLSSLTALSPLAVLSYVHVNPAFLGIGAGSCIMTMWWFVLMASMLMNRVKEEEKMLKRLGRDWDVYANKHWRFIDFVYYFRLCLGNKSQLITSASVFGLRSNTVEK